MRAERRLSLTLRCRTVDFQMRLRRVIADQARALRTRKSFLEFSSQEPRYLKSATSLSSSPDLRVRCMSASVVPFCLPVTYEHMLSFAVIDFQAYSSGSCLDG